MSEFRESEELPPVVVDRRAPRRKALLAALAVSRDGTRTVDCAVREISDAGARLQVPKDHIVPVQFFLVIGAKAAVHEAQVIWVGAKEVGLKFVNTYGLDDLKRADLLFLRRLLVERQPRSGTDVHSEERRRRRVAFAGSALRKPF
jgi:hypothetical protein